MVNYLIEKKKSLMRIGVLVITAVLLAAPWRASIASPLEDNPPTFCRNLEFSLSLAPGDTTKYRVSGQLCYKPPLPRRVVQVLISGATYGKGYWDFPLRPEMYSYVKAMTDAGYATLNLERIGIGQSDHPPGDQVTIESNAFMIHQVVDALRNGDFTGFSVSKVILVGHSFGSGIAIVEAATYGDVDGVIVSGFLHNIGPGFFAIPSALYPAQFDPRFAGQNLPDGYFTTLPGTRESLFYSSPNAEADVIALDESTKETVTLGEAISFVNLLFTQPGLSQGIRVPVLSVVGQFDTGFCTPPLCPQASAEPGFYAPEAQLEVNVIPDAGHCLNLHLNSQNWFAIASDWSDRHFGSNK